jgi:putative hemolysin
VPAAFERCLRAGGKIRTKKLQDGSYMKICVLPGGKKGPRGGRTVAGKVHKKKEEKE